MGALLNWEHGGDTIFTWWRWLRVVHITIVFQDRYEVGMP